MTEEKKEESGKKVSLVLKGIISVALLSFLLYRIGLNQFVGTFGNISIGWVLVGILILTLSNITGSLQWHLLLQGSGIQVAFKRTIMYYYTGLFFNNFLLGFVGGDLFRVYDITKHSGRNSTAISTVFVDRLIGMFTMCLLALIFAFFTIDLFHVHLILYPIIGGVIVLTSTICFFYFKSFAKKFQGFGERLLPVTIHQKIHDIYNGINYFKYHTQVLIKLLFISFATQALRILTHYCAARSLMITLPWWDYFVLIPLISLVSMLPISIGGLGVREQSGVVLFGFLGLNAPLAFAMQLLSYFINILCSIPGGGSFIVRKHGNS